jgi:hypothetical protein
MSKLTDRIARIEELLASREQAVVVWLWPMGDDPNEPMIFAGIIGGTESERRRISDELEARLKSASTPTSAGTEPLEDQP